MASDQSAQNDRPWTILRLLTWSDQYLKDKGIPDPRLSSELLLGSVLGMDRLGLYLKYDQPLSAAELKVYKEKLIRRAADEPVAYILGQKEFWSLPFRVDRSVLIPRPETERLVEEAQKLSLPDPFPKNILELGTGSGAVIISLVKTLSTTSTPMGLTVGVDRSAAALKTARDNACRHGVGDALVLIRGDWLTPFKAGSPWVHLLLVNPPYLSAEDLTRLDPGIRDYEPLEALDGGPDGLAAIRSILGQARSSLVPGGWLLMEIGETQGERVLKLARENGWQTAQILPDLAGKDRVLKARRP